MSKKVLSYLIPCVLFGALFYVADFRNVLDILAKVQLIPLGFLLLISFAMVLVSALKWRLFLRAFGGQETLSFLYAQYLLGYFVNAFLPSQLGGDVARSLEVGKRTGKKEAFISTILERYMGLLAMVSLALVCVWFVSALSWKIAALIYLMAAGLGVLSLLACSSWLEYLIKKFPVGERLARPVVKLREGISFLKDTPGVFLKALLLSYVYHSLTALNTWTAAQTIGWKTVPFGELFVVLPVILAIGSLPITPSGLGLQEGAWVFFLTRLGATPGQALSLALLLRAKSLFLAFLGGGVWLKNRALSRRGLSTSLNRGVSMERRRVRDVSMND